MSVGLYIKGIGPAFPLQMEVRGHGDVAKIEWQPGVKDDKQELQGHPEGHPGWNLRVPLFIAGPLCF